MKECYEIGMVVAEVGTISTDLGLAISTNQDMIFFFTPCCKTLHAHPYGGETVLEQELVKTMCLKCEKRYSINFYGSRIQAQEFCTSIGLGSVSRIEQWIRFLTPREITVEMVL